MLENVEANQERLQKWSGKKIQEVLLKAMAGKLKWWEAAESEAGTDGGSGAGVAVVPEGHCRVNGNASGRTVFVANECCPTTPVIR